MRPETPLPGAVTIVTTILARFPVRTFFGALSVVLVAAFRLGAGVAVYRSAVSRYGVSTIGPISPVLW
ncbi:hypothetical protein GCM10018966_007480 [Streptomyces yanii]